MENENIVNETPVEREQPAQRPAAEKKTKKGLLSVLKKPFAPQNRKKTIIVLAAVVLVAVAAFLLVFNSPEAVAKRFVKATFYNDYGAKYDLLAYDYHKYLIGDKTAVEYFEGKSESLNEDIGSWKDLEKYYLRNQEKAIFKEYGEYKLSIDVMYTEDIPNLKFEDDFKEELEELKEKTDFNPDSIKDVKRVTLKIRIDGEGEDNIDRSVAVVYLVKIGMSWKVFEWNR